MLAKRTFPNAPAGTPVERIYDYPHYFDLSYNYGYENEIRFFDGMIRRATGGRPGRALELAAGSGRIACPLAALGHSITALDRERGMLEALTGRAKREGSRIETVEDDMRSLAMPEPVFDVVYTPLGLSTTLWSREETLDHFGRVRECLRPGGLIVLPGPAATRLDKVIPHYAEWETRRDAIQTRTRFFYTQRPCEEADVADFTHEITVLDAGRYHVLVDSGVLRVYTKKYVDFILEHTAGIRFVGWFEMYDAAHELPTPPDPSGTAATVFRKV